MRTVRCSSRLGEVVFVQGGVCPRGGVCPSGVCIPACTEADTPPMDRIFDIRLWKYYLAATSLRTVIIYSTYMSHLWCFFLWWIDLKFIIIMLCRSYTLNGYFFIQFLKDAKESKLKTFRYLCFVTRFKQLKPPVTIAILSSFLVVFV